MTSTPDSDSQFTDFLAGLVLQRHINTLTILGAQNDFYIHPLEKLQEHQDTPEPSIDTLAWYLDHLRREEKQHEGRREMSEAGRYIKLIRGVKDQIRKVTQSVNEGRLIDPKRPEPPDDLEKERAPYRTKQLDALLCAEAVTDERAPAESHEQTVQSGAGEKAAPKQNVKAKPAQRLQEEQILQVISELGYKADALPKWIAGKPGVKAEVKDSFANWSDKVFDKAWERLRADKSIQEAD